VRLNPVKFLVGMLVASIGLAGCGGAKTSATPMGRDQLRDCCVRWLYRSRLSRGQPPRRRPSPCVSHERLLHRQRRKRRLRISSPKTPSLVASREMSPMCRSGGIPEPFGNAWMAKVRCRHAISATAGTDRR
jgi:hypothetical protein